MAGQGGHRRAAATHRDGERVSPDNPSERPVTYMVEQPARSCGSAARPREPARRGSLGPAGRRAAGPGSAKFTSFSIKETPCGCAPELAHSEPQRLSLPFAEDEVPSEAELRVAHAEPLGSLERRSHGIQMTLFAQQMAARAQLEQMRKAPPLGTRPGQEEALPPQQHQRASGPYL